MQVTASHSIFDVEIEKDIECKEHEDEVVRFYCEPCETCICVLCTFNEHKVSIFTMKLKIPLIKDTVFKNKSFVGSLHVNHYLF